MLTEMGLSGTMNDLLIDESEMDKGVLFLSASEILSVSQLWVCSHICFVDILFQSQSSPYCVH